MIRLIYPIIYETIELFDQFYFKMLHYYFLVNVPHNIFINSILIDLANHSRVANFENKKRKIPIIFYLLLIELKLLYFG